jgi:hypothetical protein
VRVRGVGLRPARENAQHPWIELDADLDDRRAAEGIDPERPADLALISSESVRCRIEKKGLEPGAGNWPGGRISMSSPRRSAAMRAMTS